MYIISVNPNFTNPPFYMNKCSLAAAKYHTMFWVNLHTYCEKLKVEYIWVNYLLPGSTCTECIKLYLLYDTIFPAVVQ